MASSARAPVVRSASTRDVLREAIPEPDAMAGSFARAVKELTHPETQATLGLSIAEIAAVNAQAARLVTERVPTSSTAVGETTHLLEGGVRTASAGSSEDSTGSDEAAALTSAEVRELRAALISNLRDFDFNAESFTAVKAALSSMLAGDSATPPAAGAAKVADATTARSPEALETGTALQASLSTAELSGASSPIAAPPIHLMTAVPAIAAPSTTPQRATIELPHTVSPFPVGAGLSDEAKLDILLSGMLEILEACEKSFGKQSTIESLKALIKLLKDPATAKPSGSSECHSKAAIPLLLGLSGYFAVQFGVMSFATASAISWLGPCLAGALFSPMSATANCAQIYVSLEKAPREVIGKTKALIQLLSSLFDKIPHCVATDERSAAMCSPTVAGVAEAARTVGVAAGKFLTGLTIVGGLVALAASGAVSTGATVMKAYTELGLSGGAANAAITHLIRSVLVARGICNLPGKAYGKIKIIGACCGAFGQRKDWKKGTAAACGLAAGVVGGYFYTDGQRVNIPEYFAEFMNGLFGSRGIEVDPTGQFAQSISWAAFSALMPLNFMFMGDGVEEFANYILRNQHGRALASAALVVSCFTGFPGVASVDTAPGSSESAQIGIRANAFIAAAASNYASLLATGPCRDSRERGKLREEISELSNFYSALLKYFQGQGTEEARKVAFFIQQMQNFIVAVGKEIDHLVGANTISRAVNAAASTVWCGSHLPGRVVRATRGATLPRDVVAADYGPLS